MTHALPLRFPPIRHCSHPLHIHRWHLIHVLIGRIVIHYLSVLFRHCEAVELVRHRLERKAHRGESIWLHCPVPAASCLDGVLTIFSFACGWENKGMPAASSNRERRASPHHYRFRVSPDLIGKLGQRGRGGHCVKGTFGSASPDPIASTNRQKRTGSYELRAVACKHQAEWS